MADYEESCSLPKPPNLTFPGIPRVRYVPRVCENYFRKTKVENCD